jgi:uncharacterized membrane protein
MNQTHIHIVITHLPIFGSVLGALVLIHGLGVKSNQTIITAYYLFILSSIGAAIAYYTGEAAEETVEDFAGVLESSIKAHEDFAIYALVSLIILGVMSILGVIFTFKNSTFIRSMAFFVLFVSLVSFGLVARTGYLGGQIRHIELADGTNSSSGSEGNAKASEDSGEEMDY